MEDKKIEIIAIDYILTLASMGRELNQRGIRSANLFYLWGFR